MESSLVGFLIGLVVGIAVTAGLLYAYYRNTLQPNQESLLNELKTDIDNRRRLANKEIETLLTDARTDARELRAEAEKQIERRYADLAKAEERIDRIRASQDEQLKKLEQREQQLNRRQSNIDKRRNRLEEHEKTLRAEQAAWEETRIAELEKVAGLSLDAARAEVLQVAERDASQDIARIIREVEERARETAEERARRILVDSMQRIGTLEVPDVTTSTVPIPSEEMKGRIIGRNGRNIRAFEQAAGVDIVVDDTPEAVSVSSFDSVRREVARRTLEKLISDGRIHPTRIEKLLKDARREVDRDIIEAGQQAALDANIHGLHREILKMMGRLVYRTSYGQNQLHHAVEASRIAAILAAEIGLDVETAKVGAFLHDIGKAMDHNQEGTHAQLGADFIKRFNVSPKVVNAVASHHHEAEQETPEAILVEIADAISGARPGARRESLENYIKRVRTLEDIAKTFDGVDTAYALQAGREIRILVRPDQVDDLQAIRLSKEIARTIEDSMQYPGQIQVTIIRETRAVGIAK